MRSGFDTTPWRSLWELHDQVEAAFREVSAPRAVSPVWLPPTDVAQDAEAYWIWFDLPGVAPEQITLRVSGGSLLLSGRKPEPAEAGQVLRAERRWGRFAAAVPLPRDADPGAVTARLDQGVLTVRLARRIPSTERTIPIEQG